MNNLEEIYEAIESLSSTDAVFLIQRLVKCHGGEVLDRALDQMIEDDEHGEWPETVHEWDRLSEDLY